MPYQAGSRRRQEDYPLQGAGGYRPAGFLWAHAQLNMAAPWECVLANFSGVLGIAAVQDRGRTLLFAPDPLGAFTVSCTLVETNDQDHMHPVLPALKERGGDGQGALTDGSPLYKDSWHRYWTDIAPQLGLWPVIKAVNTLRLDGGRAVNNRLNRQGNPGCQKRRGRPSQNAQQQQP